ncbi:uncharacterized protein LOC144437012 [Glandiceps talaboti]
MAAVVPSLSWIHKSVRGESPSPSWKSLRMDKIDPGGRDTIKTRWTLSMIYETEGPEPRTLNNSVSVVDDNMYVFGGILNSKASNSLYMLNTQKLHWTQIETYGVPPEPRCDHAAAVVKKKIYIFGGSGGEKIWFNDLHIYDAATSTWSAPKLRGKAPIARGCHSFTTHKDKEIFVFGGFNDTYEGNNGTFGEMCKFSVGKMKWKYPFHTGTKPTERYGHTTFICHGRIFIIGGMDELTYFNEIQVAKIINPAERKKANPPHVKADTSSTDVTSEMKPLLQRTDREHNERLTPNWMRNSASSTMSNVNSSFNIHPLDTDTSMASISRLSLNDTQPRSYSTPNLGHNPPRFPFDSTYNPNSLPPLGGQLKRQNSKAGSNISSISVAEKDAVKRVSKAFRILQERFDEIDEERRLLENDKVTLNNDKERFLEQYRNQQRDIQQILEQHRLQNQEWLQQRTLDLEREKEEVARQRAKLTAEYQQLIHEERFRERTSNFIPPMSSYSGTV